MLVCRGRQRGKTGWRDAEPQGIQTIPAWGCISPAAQEGLEKPKWSSGVIPNPRILFLGYLQFLLSVQGAQAIHPSQEDPVAEKQREGQHHQELLNKAVTEIEPALLAPVPSHFPGKWRCRTIKAAPLSHRSPKGFISQELLTALRKSFPNHFWDPPPVYNNCRDSSAVLSSTSTEGK